MSFSFAPTLSGGPSQASQSSGDLGSGGISFASNGSTGGGAFNLLTDLVLPVVIGLAVIWAAKKFL